MAGMYPDDQTLQMFGETVVYPGLVNGKFSNGSFTDPLEKPSFIPAESMNLILDNLEEAIKAEGKTPNNTGGTQLAAILALKAPRTSPALTGTPTAPTASANTNSTQIATTAYADNAAHPVGSTYEQVPAVASNDYNTAFPAAERPANLFGGTWTTIWENTDRVFWRSGGSLEAETDRVSGKQEDAIRNITGKINASGQGVNEGFLYSNSTIDPSNNISFGGAYTGIIYKNVQVAIGSPYGPRTSIDLRFDASRVVPTAARNRPINRFVIKWKRTA